MLWALYAGSRFGLYLRGGTDTGGCTWPY